MKSFSIINISHGTALSGKFSGTIIGSIVKVVVVNAITLPFTTYFSFLPLLFFIVAFNSTSLFLNWIGLVIAFLNVRVTLDVVGYPLEIKFWGFDFNGVIPVPGKFPFIIKLGNTSKPAACFGAFLITFISSAVKSICVFVFLLKRVVVVVILPFTGSEPMPWFVGESLNVAIFIFLGSLRLSVKNSMPSIILIPVIRLLFWKFKTWLAVDLTSAITTAIISVDSSYSKIALVGFELSPSVINQYILLFCVSVKAPIHLNWLLVPKYSSQSWLPPPLFAFLVLPKMLSIAPTSESSDVFTCILVASKYSPLGNSLSSRSLFIRPFKNVRFNSGIF